MTKIITIQPKLSNEEKKKIRKEYMDNLAKRKGFDNISDYQKSVKNKMYESKGFKNDTEYLNYWAVKKGFKNLKEYQNFRSHKNGKCLPMSENIKCSLYLSEYISKKIISKIFEEPKKMPYGNIGYDYTCKYGYKIDIKSGCLHKNFWTFYINQNKIADCFLLIAFDNRENLNPIHIWLIKKTELINNNRSLNRKLNSFKTLNITNNSKSLIKYQKYELADKLNEAINVCNDYKNVKKI